MSKKKSTKPKLTQAEKEGLRKLKKKGLYKPKKPHAAPTKYAKGLLAKFWDVVTGVSDAITAPFKIARQYINRDAKPGAPRSKGKQVVLPVLPREHLFIDKINEEAGAVFDAGQNGRYIRTPFKHRVNDLASVESQLGPNDRIAVPFYRGKGRATEWQEMSRDEFMRFWSKYGPGGNEVDGSGTPRLFEQLGDFIEKARFEPFETPKTHAHKAATREERREKVASAFDNMLAKRAAKRNLL